jgi:hypothetical protein
MAVSVGRVRLNAELMRAETGDDQHEGHDDHEDHRG